MSRSDGKASILLVDDSPANLLAMEVTLERLKEETVRVSSGPEALEAVRQREFAVVLLDVQMPVMDGLETAARIRDWEHRHRPGRPVPIIFVTAAELTEDHVLRAYTEGAVDFIRKPYVPDIMRSKVKVFVELYRNTQRLQQSIMDLRQAEETIREANTRLERRVANRTAELRTALERAEASELRYRTLAEAMPQIAWTASPDGQIDYLNDRWVEVTGMSAQDGLGHGWASRVHPDDIPLCEKHWMHSLKTGEPLSMEVRLLCADDTPRWFLARAEPMRDAQGTILKWLGTSTDVQAHKHAEELLEQARDQAVEASNAKSLFLANMSHELRTPLNAIIGYGEILQEELPEEIDAKSREDVRRIIHAGQHLLALVNDVLDLAKIEAGKMDLTLTTFSLDNVIHQVTSSVTPLAVQRSNKLSIDCNGDCGIIHADEMKVRQVLLNLLSNACKFTQNGSILVSARRHQNGSGEIVRFSVKDTGIGIAPDQRSKLFKEFSQADPSATRTFGGTGLGLALSRKFVEMMDGKIWVESQPNEGSEFIVELPATVRVAS